MSDSRQILAEYVQTGSEEAFRELVARYIDLVYSAAIRLVNGNAPLAEDVTQMVFADLARRAHKLSREVMLGGWLHRHTCYVASTTMRSERRRQARERQAMEMNALEDHSAANLALVAPMVDEAINQLRPEDRTAILLRFFEQKDFRSVGEILGSNEEAARKRVNRALAKLESLLKKRGVTLSATALGATLITQAVTAAPAGLAASISAIALSSAPAAGAATAWTILKIMSMTKLKVGIISAMVAAGVAVPVVMQQRTEAKLRKANEALRQQRDRNSELATENELLTQRAAQASAPARASNTPSPEVLRLRGEVARLHREKAEEKTPITQDMVKTRYEHAQELARGGDAAGALKEYLWCFDTGMPRVGSYAGVRTSFLLGSIWELGKTHPEALAALRERRDQVLQRMQASATDSEAAMDFAALNRTLKEDQNTLAVFDQLPADDSRRKALASAAYEQLVAEQRYNDALLGRPYEQMSMLFESNPLNRPLPATISHPEMIRKSQRDFLIASTAKNVEVLAGAGELDHARTLATRLLAVDSSPETKALLQQQVTRAGRPDLLKGVPNR